MGVNEMPIGVVCNALAVFLGGLIGTKMGDRLSGDFKGKLNLVFGVCAMSMGISSIVLMENMPAVMLSIILGTIIGLAIHLGARIEQAGRRLQVLFSRILPGKNSGTVEEQSEKTALLVTAIVLFCASGTGIYGSIVAGMSGDHSILFAKSVLDLFTAMIFACSLGIAVSAIAAPQFVVLIILFAGAKLIYPLTTPSMINDFKACGGILLLATGLRIAKVKMFPIADMIPAMILAMPLSWLWTNAIIPLLA